MSQASSRLASTIDASVGPVFKADNPGATMIVVKDGKTVFRKAYGLADVLRSLSGPCRAFVVTDSAGLAGYCRFNCSRLIQ